MRILYGFLLLSLKTNPKCLNERPCPWGTRLSSCSSIGGDLCQLEHQRDPNVPLQSCQVDGCQHPWCLVWDGVGSSLQVA